MSPLDLLALTVLLVLLPAGAVLQLRMLTPDLLAGLERVSAYLSTVVMLVLIGGGSYLVGARSGGPAALGLVPLPASELLLWTLGVTGGGLLSVWLFQRLGMAVGAREHPILRALLPRTTPERRAFVGVSVAAGLGEELAYRGYVLLLLVPILGAGAALALTSAVFGVLHAYQGALGMARTAAMGAILGAGLLGSGSLWPCILAHTLLDLLAGLWLGERLMVPEGDSGV